MQREGGGGAAGGGGSLESSEIRVIDRKRVNDVLDKHLERTSPSNSRGVSSNLQEKDVRISVPSTSAGKFPLDYPGGLDMAKNFSDGSYPLVLF